MSGTLRFQICANGLKLVQKFHFAPRRGFLNFYNEKTSLKYPPPEFILVNNQLTCNLLKIKISCNRLNTGMS